MGYTCYFDFAVRIRDDAVEDLATAIKDEDVGKHFSLDGDILTGNCCEGYGSRYHDTLKRFIRNQVSDAAAESIVVEQGADFGQFWRYGIGPEAGKVLASCYLTDIIKSLDVLTPEHLGVLVDKVQSFEVVAQTERFHG